jgi:hypothetical protein
MTCKAGQCAERRGGICQREISQLELIPYLRILKMFKSKGIAASRKVYELQLPHKAPNMSYIEAKETDMPHPPGESDILDGISSKTVLSHPMAFPSKNEGERYEIRPRISRDIAAVSNSRIL